MISRRQSPDRRRMTYFLDLLTRDTYNKEIKLFGLGDFFITRGKRSQSASSRRTVPWSSAAT